MQWLTIVGENVRVVMSLVTDMNVGKRGLDGRITSPMEIPCNSPRLPVIQRLSVKRAINSSNENNVSRPLGSDLSQSRETKWGNRGTETLDGAQVAM